jgi:hypothetical protein
MPTSYQQHDLAKFVPAPSEQDFAALVADMQAKGQQEPIKVYQGKIIDGWSRYRACQQLGLEPKVAPWQPQADQSVVGAVVSWNLPRRHLTSAQKAALALLIEPELAKEAKERQRAAGGAAPHQRAKKRAAARKAKKPEPEPEEPQEPQLVEGKKDDQAGRAAEHAARIAGTNRQYVHDVKRIKQYSERLFQQVINGELAITEARKIMRRKQKARELRQAAQAATRRKSRKPSYTIEVSDVALGLKGLERASARLIVTEPPFTEFGGPPRDPGRWQWAERWIEECFRILTPDGSLWIVCDPAVAYRFQTITTRVGLTSRLIPWYYTYGKVRGNDFPDSYLAILRCRASAKHHVFNPRPFTLETGKLWNDVWGLEKPIGLLTDNAAERIPDFPQQLPLELVRPLVEAHSEPGDLVVEPFAGAATAGVACLELGGRRYVGIEASPRLAHLALERLQAVKAAKWPKELTARA